MCKLILMHQVCNYSFWSFKFCRNQALGAGKFPVEIHLSTWMYPDFAIVRFVGKRCVFRGIFKSCKLEMARAKNICWNSFRGLRRQVGVCPGTRGRAPSWSQSTTTSTTATTSTSTTTWSQSHFKTCQTSASCPTPVDSLSDLNLPEFHPLSTFFTCNVRFCHLRVSFS